MERLIIISSGDNSVTATIISINEILNGKEYEYRDALVVMLFISTIFMSLTDVILLTILWMSFVSY